MPNQLARTKRRQSVAEHAAVLAALSQIAGEDKKPVMDVCRQALREFIRARVADPSRAAAVRVAVQAHVPHPPKRFKSAAQLRRFKREQREFDQLMLELHLARPEEIQTSNSIARHSSIRLTNFAEAHA